MTFKLNRKRGSETRLHIRRPRAESARRSAESAAARETGPEQDDAPREKPQLGLKPRNKPKPLHPLILVGILVLVMIFMAPLYMHRQWSIYNALFGKEDAEPAPEVQQEEKPARGRRLQLNVVKPDKPGTSDAESR